MTALTAGITPAGDGIDGVVWNILGQTYKPVAHGDSCFAFDTLFPDGTFVPPHIHPSQDEFIRVLEGRFDLVLDGQPKQARSGDLSACRRASCTASSTRSGAPVRALFWVTPAKLSRPVHAHPQRRGPRRGGAHRVGIRGGFSAAAGRLIRGARLR